MEQLSTRVVYSNPWMTVREDEIRRPDGSDGIYGVVEKPDFALVLPRWEKGFWLVEQFRYPVGRRAWEFPQGSWGAGAAGEQTELARRELAEETGLRAADLTHLGHLYEAYGYSTQGFDVYLATGLAEGEPDREPTEQDMIHRAFTDAEITAMIRSGAMVDAPSLAALTLYHLASPSIRSAPGTALPEPDAGHRDSTPS
ncbi:NUDIX hydrolase [Actinoplanes sp. DH11]|uniref:NUDIX domain-containing protein n=1 Tax=Actinoplanes sp. DH11 TaxID=2857011 RepID=UPI001E537A62|nr:NUDIX hydrolase [Actinoplanes sp. DH11]